MRNKVIGRTNSVYEDVAVYPKPPMAEAEFPSLAEMVRPFYSTTAVGWLMKVLFVLAGYPRFRVLGKENLEVLLRDCHFRGFGYMPTNQVATLLIKDGPSENSPGASNCLDRAARLVVAAIEFREAYFQGDLTPDRHNGKAREMGQYANLFGTHLAFERDLCLYKSPATGSINIVVNGCYYILNISKLGGADGYRQIKKSLEEIVREATGDIGDTKIFSPGFIAASSITINHKTWRRSKNRKAHKVNLDKLKNTLFTLCLDLDTVAESDAEAAKAIHSMNYGNRWHHASMQIVILANAKAGVIANFDAGIDGNVMVRMGAELYRRSQVPVHAGTVVPELQEGLSYEKLTWKMENSCLEDAKRELKETTDSQQATFYLQGLGKQAYATAGLAPVPTFVLAMMLALYEIEGRIPRVAQALDMSRFRYMGISGAEVTTPEAEVFVRRFVAATDFGRDSGELRRLLSAAIQSQMNVCKVRRSQITQDVVTHVFVKSRARHQKIAIRLFEFLLRLQGESYKKDIMISHPALCSEVPILGRPGARLFYVNYFGLHYQIDDQKTTMTFMPAVDWKVENDKASELIGKYTRQLIQLGMLDENLAEFRRDEQTSA